MLSETFSIVSYSRFQCLGVKILSTLKRVYQIQRKRNHLSKSISALPTCAIDRDAIPTNHPRLLTFRGMLRACSDLWTKKIACRLKKQRRLTQNDHLALRIDWSAEATWTMTRTKPMRRVGWNAPVLGVKSHIYWLAFWPWSAKISWQTPRTVIETCSCTLIFLSQKSSFNLPSSPNGCHVFLDPPQRSRAVGSERWIKYRASLLP